MDNHPSLELTILMPCLDEEKTVGACVDAAMVYLKASGCRGEVLVCDNGSTDNSVSVAEAHGARTVLCPDRGYGCALRHGMNSARGAYIIMGDSDMSYDFYSIGDMHRLLLGGADLVIGNRFHTPPRPDTMPLSHRIGAPLLSRIARLRFGCDVSDFHCGLRGISAKALSRLDLSCTGMEFATEMIMKAHRKNLRIAQTPVILHPDGRSGPSHLRTIRDGLRHLLLILHG